MRGSWWWPSRDRTPRRRTASSGWAAYCRCFPCTFKCDANAALLHLDQVLFEMSFSCGHVGHCVGHLDRVLCLVRLTPLRYVCIVLDYSQQSELPHGDVKSHLQSDQTPSWLSGHRQHPRGGRLLSGSGAGQHPSQDSSGRHPPVGDQAAVPGGGAAPLQCPDVPPHLCHQPAQTAAETARWVRVCSGSLGGNLVGSCSCWCADCVCVWQRSVPPLWWWEIWCRGRESLRPAAETWDRLMITTRWGKQLRNKVSAQEITSQLRLNQALPRKR